MPNPTLKQAVVIGAGIGGLAAAKAVAVHFEKVIVFDRDALPDGPAPRPGTPQARHTHNLLAGGFRALEHLFPGIELDLFEAGAVRMRMRSDMRFEVPGFDPLPHRDFGFDQFALSRPSLERVCRRRVERESNIEFRPRIARDGAHRLARQSRGRGGALRGHSRNAGKSRGGPGRRRLGASVANASLPRSNRFDEAANDRDRHRSGLCDGHLREARGRSNGLALHAARADAAGEQPLGNHRAHGRATMERFALRKPRRRAARRHRRVHGLRQVVPHADDLQCDPRRKAHRRHRAVRDAVQRAARFRQARSLPARSSPARGLGLPLPPGPGPGNVGGGPGGSRSREPPRVAAGTRRSARWARRSILH